MRTWHARSWLIYDEVARNIQKGSYFDAYKTIIAKNTAIRGLYNVCFFFQNQNYVKLGSQYDACICGNFTREEAEEQLELWRNAIENKGLRVSRNKTEYLPPSSCHDNVKLGGEKKLRL